MKRITILILSVFTVFATNAQENSISKVWVADNGNGTYKNPVVNADYSDPDAIRVGDDYYMISSSFTAIPGLPILHSKDLVNWTITGHALNRLTPEERYSKVQHGGGVWAPSIRYHNNEFYIYYPDPDLGIYLVKSKKITGPWSDPILVEAGKGLIDPCPLWDNNGKVYLVHAFAGSRAGIKSIIVVKEMNAEGTRTISNAVLVYDGHEKDPTIEGPKFYKRNGYYYIFAPAGGVSTGWQLVLRSKTVYGPYERKVVMDQGNTSINGPHQGAWVDTKTGENWFLHFQDKEVYGRVVHLQPMKWVNDWPVIGIDKDGDGKGEPVLVYKKPNVGKTYPVNTPQESDEFNNKKMGLQWQWQGNPSSTWALSTTSGTLRMPCIYQQDTIMNNIWNSPNILAQKLPAEEFTAGVKLTLNAKSSGDRFGFVILGTDYAFISIQQLSDGQFYVVCKENLMADKNGAETQTYIMSVKGNEIYLEIKVDKGGVCNMSYIESGTVTNVTHQFTAKSGRWVGAKIGMFCTTQTKTNDAGYADIDWFRIEKSK